MADQAPTSPAIYDRWSWHVEGTFPKDATPEQGFVHIGLYLEWVILHGLVDLDWWERRGLLDDLSAVTRRDQTACSVRDAIDGALTSDMLSAEGAAFSDAYYAADDGYLVDYQRTFGKAADRYAVPDTWEAYDQIAAAIDERYAAWRAAGRPDRRPRRPGLLDGLLDVLPFLRRRRP